MISLAGRDILHGWGKFVLTGVGLGLLIGVTLSMAGVYRGMVDDAQALLDNSGADLWVVQKDTLGPYAEPSSLNEDTERPIRAMAGVDRAAGVTYLTMQIAHEGSDVRVMVVGAEVAVPGEPGQPPHLLAGRRIVQGHYEAVADVKTGFAIGDRLKVRRNSYRIVGLTSRMVSSGGDPMLFLSLKDAQDAQFDKDSDAIMRQRARTASSPVLNPPGNPAVAEAVNAAQTSSNNVNAVLVTVKPGADADVVAAAIRRWQRVTVYTRVDMENILIDKMIANSARQIGMFLVILAIVSAAIVAFIIYTMTIGKIREIAVLKLIGTRNRTIAGMILQQALGLGLIGFAVGKIAASFWAPFFPKYVLLLPADSLRGFFVVMAICTLASLLAIDAAIKVDPAEAIEVVEGILIENLVKTYGSGDTAVHALRGVNMAVAKGEVVGLIGPSGSGKSTLLKCLGAVIKPSSGRMTIGDTVIYEDGWKVSDLSALRRDLIGFIFQAPYLIPFLDVTDNVALLPMLAGKPNAVARKEARDLLEVLDVGHRAGAMPSQLSGGEQQRVAIARALVNRPPVILADEPTAPLDSVRALAVVDLLNSMARQFDTAIIVVTHDEKIIPTFRRLYNIRDGVTIEEKRDVV